MLEDVLANPEILAKMAAQAKNCGRRDAAQSLANLVLKDQFYAFHAA